MQICFTHRGFCTEQPLHRAHFMQRSLDAERILHREAFTQKDLCTQELLHTAALHTKSPSVNQKTEGGRVAYIFENCMHQGGRYPLTKTGKKDFQRSFRGLPKDGNDKSIQHRGVNSMRMSYHIDQKCMKPMGGNPPENYEECMQARLCRPMIAKHSHVHRYM